MKRLLAGIAAAAGLSACGGPTYCVARGARVTTPRGLRPIEELGVGDEVIAVDPLTGAFEATRISAVRSSQREVGAVQFSGISLAVTTDHPLFDPDAGVFAPAGDWFLRKRSSLSVFDGARVSTVKVSAVDAFVRVETVFDLTVESPIHTFVAEGVVVHNKQPAACTIPGGTQSLAINEDGPPCTCTNGTAGLWRCESPGQATVCAKCEAPDGGSADGG